MADHPDTDKILYDIDLARTKVIDFIAEDAAGEGLTATDVPELINAARDLLDHLAYLRHVLAEGAPLPREWKALPARGTEADVQLGHLWAAAYAVDAAVSTTEPAPESLMGELHAKAAHLAGCVFAVDYMCSKGQLPARWSTEVLRPADQALLDGLAAEHDREEAEQAHYRALAANAKVDTRPDGFWGTVEIPGFRNNTGWITEETRFGQQMAVVRNWDGAEVAAVIPGPNGRVLHEATPMRRPDPVTGIYQPAPPAMIDGRGDPVTGIYQPAPPAMIDGRGRDDGNPYGEEGPF